MGESPSQLCGSGGYCDVLINQFLPVGSDTSNITLFSVRTSFACVIPKKKKKKGIFVRKEAYGRDRQGSG